MLRPIEFTMAISHDKFTMSRDEIKRISLVGRVTTLTTYEGEEIQIAEDYQDTVDRCTMIPHPEEPVSLQGQAFGGLISIKPSLVAAVEKMDERTSIIYFIGSAGGIKVSHSFDNTQKKLGRA